MDHPEFHEITNAELFDWISVDVVTDIQVVDTSERTSEADFMVFLRDLHHLCGAGDHRHPGSLAHLTEILRQEDILPIKAELVD